MKAFIFTSLLLHARSRNNNIKTFREPLYLGLDFGLAVWIYSYLQGLFICGCFYKTPLNFKSKTPEYIITGCNGTIPRFVNKAMQVAMRIFIGNNNKTVWGNLFSVIDRYATSNRVQVFRFNVYPFIPYLMIGGKGVNLLFTPSINFASLMQVTDLQGGEAISKAYKQLK